MTRFLGFRFSVRIAPVREDGQCTYEEVTADQAQELTLALRATARELGYDMMGAMTLEEEGFYRSELAPTVTVPESADDERDRRLEQYHMARSHCDAQRL